MWHSCGTFSMDALFERCEPYVRSVFKALSKAVRAVARDVRVVPQKTRAVFQLQTRFISIYPRKDHLLVGFVFTEKAHDARFVRIEGPITGAYVHYTRLREVTAIDATVKGWIGAALPYGRRFRPLGKRRTEA
jgi:hypothetical protein